MNRNNPKISLKEYLCCPTKECMTVSIVTKAYLTCMDVAVLQYIHAFLSFSFRHIENSSFRFILSCRYNRYKNNPGR